MDERRPGDDHRAAHREGAENSPKKQAMLPFHRHAEIGEDHRHHQDIVEGKGKFDDITGGELDGFLPRPPKHQRARKQHGQRHPESAPGHCFRELDRARAAMEHAQVEGQAEQDENNETEPVPGRDFCHL